MLNNNMNDETYEALSKVISALKKYEADAYSVLQSQNIKQVEKWIDEVSKDYNQGGAMFDN